MHLRVGDTVDKTPVAYLGGRGKWEAPLTIARIDYQDDNWIGFQSGAGQRPNVVCIEKKHLRLVEQEEAATV